MKQIITIITLLLLLQSCNSSKTLYIGMNFTDTCSVSSLDTLPVVIEDYGFSIYNTKMGYLTGAEKNNNYIQLWNPVNGEKVFGFGSIGRGPGEFMMPFCTDIDYENNIIYVMDLITSKISKYKLLSDTVELVESFNVPKMKGGSLIKFFNDSTYVYRQFDGKSFRLILQNRYRGVLSEYEDNILDEVNINNFSSIYQSSVSVSKAKKKIILFCSELNAISCFSISENKISLDWRKFLVEPKYNIINSEFAINQNRIHKGIIHDCQVTDSSIYLLVYNTKKNDPYFTNFEDSLHMLKYSFIIKMNFEGEVIKTYKINCVPLYMVNNSNDNSMALLVNYPDFNLLTFKL